MTRTQSIPTPRAKKEAKHTQKNAATSRSWVPDLRLLILGADLCTSSLISSANFIPNCARTRRRRRENHLLCVSARPSSTSARTNTTVVSGWNWTGHWTGHWTGLNYSPTPSFRPPSLPTSLHISLLSYLPSNTSPASLRATRDL